MGYFATNTSKENHSRDSVSSRPTSGSGEESKSKSSNYGSKSGSQSSSQSQFSSKSQSGSSSQFSSSGSKSQDNTSKSHVKSKEEVKQDKHIFDRIAAGENVNGSFLAKNPPPSKAALVMDGNQKHGHVLQTGHYRYSPGFQQVREKKKNKEGIKGQEPSSQKASSIKSSTQSKKMSSDETIQKPVKSDDHNKSNKGLEKPLFGTLSERKPKATTSDKSLNLKKTPSDENKSSNKQQQTTKSHEEKSHH